MEDGIYVNIEISSQKKLVNQSEKVELVKI